MKSKLSNEKGITLVELLATIVLVSIIAALSYTVLFQGYSNYQRIKVETELRDEADLIMASLISDLFVAKRSELQLVQTCNNGLVESYVRVSKEGEPIYETGFKNKQTIVKNQPVQFYNESVKLIGSTCTGSSSEVLKSNITSTDGIAYTVSFILETTKRQTKFQKEFINTIVVIDN
ncbi:PulJ/GspJ family protein [Planococcus soli]|uniref:PulJ/GspJ family protein n=1 Tax=Planococcus soli TaxID=2666072 RepID=UPI00163D77AB|nr:prepilin-type N-terminal cleavage/methylation domain-containing protein [Planococcus soli]